MAVGLKPDYGITEDCEVFIENMQAVKIFNTCTDYWKTKPNGQYVSIDLIALGQIMVFFGVTNQHEMFTDIMAMQKAALEVFSNV